MGKKVEHITPTQAGQQQENDDGRSYGGTSLGVFTLIGDALVVSMWGHFLGVGIFREGM
jgi:hypothetical protein